jgi:DNA-binding NarL/FixJ family response regulator
MIRELPNILDRYIRQTTDHEGDLAGGLTSRQGEILQMIAEGMSTKDIALRLAVSMKTIDHTGRK